ncbi:MAG: hypothetical protein OC190_06865 [Novosphingobium aromaticivorans]|nr:hypothetical protein [Novosphingobium aromaticivorans]
MRTLLTLAAPAFKADRHYRVVKPRLLPCFYVFGHDRSVSAPMERDNERTGIDAL